MPVLQKEMKQQVQGEGQLIMFNVDDSQKNQHKEDLIYTGIFKLKTLINNNILEAIIHEGVQLKEPPFTEKIGYLLK